MLRQTASEVTRAWDLVHVLPLDAHGPRFQHFTRLNLVPPTPLGGFYIYIYTHTYDRRIYRNASVYRYTAKVC